MLDMKLNGYVACGKIGRAVILCNKMEKDGYLEPYCNKTGKDYQKLKAVAEFATPFLNGDSSSLRDLRDEIRDIKEKENMIDELDLAF